MANGAEKKIETWRLAKIALAGESGEMARLAAAGENQQ